MICEHTTGITREVVASATRVPRVDSSAGSGATGFRGMDSCDRKLRFLRVALRSVAVRVPASSVAGVSTTVATATLILTSVNVNLCDKE